MKLFPNHYMELAIKEANKAIEEVPVGCVIIDNTTKEILSKHHNQTITNNDPTAHAEILAIREACKKVSNYRLENTSIFVTLEPCDMCKSAIKQARIKNIYFGCYNNLSYKLEPKECDYYGGIYEEECQHLIKNFFKNKRS